MNWQVFYLEQAAWLAFGDCLGPNPMLFTERESRLEDSAKVDPAGDHERHLLVEIVEQSYICPFDPGLDHQKIIEYRVVQVILIRFSIMVRFPSCW